MRSDIIVLPESLYHSFWDVDPAQLNPERHWVFILERLLDYGDENAIKWVLNIYNEAEITEVVKNSRRISPKTANYWALKFNLNREEIYCFSTSYQNQEGLFLIN